MKTSRRHMDRIYGICIFPAVIIMLTGCAAGLAQKQNEHQAVQQQSIPEIKSQIEESRVAAAAPEQEGSLWEESGMLADMFANPKARRVGDVVTVRIVEVSKASNAASTNTGRDSSISGGIGSFFGAENKYAASSPFFNPFGEVKAGMSNEFDGSGSTKRSGQLTASITARVVDVLPNGNLVISGSREVMVNAEKQVITLSGIVRQMDISAENEIQSTYISDARITYSGAGVINDKQRPGWLTRALDKVWPF